MPAAGNDSQIMNDEANNPAPVRADSIEGQEKVLLKEEEGYRANTRSAGAEKMPHHRPFCGR